MMKLRPINYIEISWGVFALLFGSLIYQALEFDRSLFINVAIIFMVASPAFLARFLNVAEMSGRNENYTVAAYIAACMLAMLTLLAGPRTTEGYFFVPLLCAAAALALRWLHQREIAVEGEKEGS